MGIKGHNGMRAGAVVPGSSEPSLLSFAFACAYCQFGRLALAKMIHSQPGQGKEAPQMDCRRKIHLALLFVVCLTATCSWAQLKPGVVVEEVAKYSEAEKAGLQEGDILLNWRHGDGNDDIRSPFDLSKAEIEEAPRGKVTLGGIRGA